MITLILYLAVILAIATVYLVAMGMTRYHCTTCATCGQPTARLSTDGQYECDGCVEQRLSAAAPRRGYR